ncbi:uncharacterized protein [Amphiura filiformis]|uniref:uncharacterized protein n=1 Tax=Amphiura filiformis TaxID=82378 RepID=UPI003B221598
MDVQVKNPKALKPNYEGVPLRYEDSKPVLVQAYTHKNIIGMGQKVHSQWEKSAEIERDRAVSAAKQDVWEQAEHAKKVALEKCKGAGQHELEQTMENLKISHERSLKEEALRVEGEMKKQAAEQLGVAREKGEQVLRETVEKVKADKDKEREEAVAKAREEERQIATKAAEKVAKEVEEREVVAAKKAAEEQKNALKALEAKKNDERVQAILTAQRQEKRTAADELAKVRKEHSQEIALLKEKIKEWEGINQETWKEVEKEQKEKEDWIEEYRKLKVSYQRFIDGTNGFNQGQAEFLLE